MLDRCLNQDDWRGMHEDVVDNVLTHSRFMLLYEASVRPPQPLVSDVIVFYLDLVMSSIA